jgi:hypothetical protein
MVDGRSKPRIYDPFPVTVKGVDADGETFEFETVIDNISAGGVYLRLTRCVDPGVKLLLVIRLSTAPTDDATAHCVVTTGVVLRAEPKPGGACGVAVAFMHHHFL